MAIYLSDLLRDPTILTRSMPTPKCVACKGDLPRDDRHKTADGDMCGDCYYEALGTEIEAHPLGRP